MLKKTGGKLGKVVEYTSYPEIYEDLANGRLDYAVNGIINATALIKERGKIFAIGQPVSGAGRAYQSHNVMFGRKGICHKGGANEAARAGDHNFHRVSWSETIASNVADRG